MKQKDTKIIQLKSDLRNDCHFLTTINDIFNEQLNEDIKKMVIYEYQRPYSWGDEKKLIGEKIIKELLDNINKLDESDSSHYVGIIYLGNRKSFAYGWPIIDGQQRIITFYVLLYYFKKYRNFNNKNFDIDIKINGKLHNLDDVIEKDSKYFDNLLLKNYCDSINHVLDIIKDYFTNNNVDEQHFYKCFTTKVSFIVVVCLDKKMELNLFYAMNAQLLQLDDIDKIKAYLLINVFNNDSSKEKFLKNWSSLYKDGKDSAYLFFKILMNSLTDKISNGKVKYDKMVEVIENFINSKANNQYGFISEFENTLERFKIIPIRGDYDKIIDNYKDSDQAHKNIGVAFYLARIMKHHNKFAQEITNKNRYAKYISGEYNPIIMILIYIFTFICESEFSFKNVDGQKKINEYSKLNEKERKEKLKELWLKCKENNYLDKIEYLCKGINDQIPHINEINKCILPLLIVSKSTLNNFYETIARIIKCGKHNLDHKVPKKLLSKDPIKKEMKSDSYDWNKNKPSNDYKKMICSIYNMQILSENENKRKSDEFDLKYCKLVNGLVCQIDYHQIKKEIDERKKSLIENIEKSIYRLIK